MDNSGSNLDTETRTTSFLFFFEESYDYYSNADWFHQHWTRTYGWSLAYVLAIIGGTAYMKTRPKFELRTTLALWNTALAIFSIMGTCRMMPEFVESVQTSLTHSMCNNIYSRVKPSSFWVTAFIYSKVFELGDTAFVVLRKQNLIFLHWYHHITVMVYTFFSAAGLIGPGRWFIVMNYTVHSFMYTYYALRAMQIRVPKWAAMTLTGMQLAQMVVGIFVNTYTYVLLLQGKPCDQTVRNFVWSMLMYASYFVLFAVFFYNTYFTRPAGQKEQRPKTGTAANGYTNGVHGTKKDS